MKKNCQGRSSERNRAYPQDVHRQCLSCRSSNSVDADAPDAILFVCLLDSVFIEQRESGVFQASDRLEPVAIFLPFDTRLKFRRQSHINRDQLERKSKSGVFSRSS